MPISFHTPAHAELTFLTEVGKQLIELMGHTPNVPGAILAEDLPAALARLRAGLAATAINEKADAHHSTEEDEPVITLSRHAQPLIDLLEAARAARENVMWA